LGLLLVLMVAASFAEVVNIGALLPFLAALTSPDRILSEPRLRSVFEFFRMSDPGQALLLFTVFVCARNRSGRCNAPLAVLGHHANVIRDRKLT